VGRSLGPGGWLREEINGGEHHSGGRPKIPSIAAIASHDPSGELRWKALDNPQEDGWEREALASETHDRLKSLAERLLNQSDQGLVDLTPWLANSVQSSELIPETSIAHEDTIVRVERSTDLTSLRLYSGRGDVSGLLSSSFGWLSDSSDIEFKVIAMTSAESDSWSSNVSVSLRGRINDRSAEQHATWAMDWRRDDAGVPQIASLRVTSFEQVTRTQPIESLFVECTPSLLARNTSYESQILKDARDRARRLPARSSLDIGDLRGFALGDVNGDELDDLYICDGLGWPNRLFLQQPNGRLEDASAAWGVDWIDDSRSALLLDLDNDGDRDLVIGVYRGLVILSNEKQRGFQLRQVLPTGESLFHLCAADYNLDGRLDLYAGVYSPNELL